MSSKNKVYIKRSINVFSSSYDGNDLRVIYDDGVIDDFRINRNGDSSNISVYSIISGVEALKYVYARGRCSDMELMMDSLSRQMTSRISLPTRFGIGGIICVMVLGIGLCLNCSWHGNKDHNSEHSSHGSKISDALKVMQQQGPISSGNVPMATAPMISNFKSPDRAVNTDNNAHTMEELNKIKTMLSSGSSFEDIMKESENLPKNIGDGFRDKLKNLMREQDKEQQSKNDIDKTKSDMSVSVQKDVQGNSTLTSGDIHIPEPGGGVSQFGLN